MFDLISFALLVLLNEGKGFDFEYCLKPFSAVLFKSSCKHNSVDSEIDSISRSNMQDALGHVM